jgi:aspartyl-tRNA(Asn)/glutamyl-tRNA(Gln) amidotransferase subunit A
MTRTVRDAAIAYQAMAIRPTGYVPPQAAELSRTRIGVPRNYYFDRVDPEVSAAVKRALDHAQKLGARLVEVEVPDMVALTEAGATCLLSEAAATLRRYLDRRDQFSDEVLARLDQGRKILAIDYLEAIRVRRHTGREFAKLWDQVECLFTPSTPITAPPIGDKFVTIDGKEEEVRSAGTRFTRGMNALGLPVISIPCGFSKSEMPIGLQIIAGGQSGEQDADDLVLRVAAGMEDAMGFGGRIAPLRDAARK